MIDDTRDTIVAIASGVQRSPIGVIRVSGAGCKKIIRRIFRDGGLKHLKDRNIIKGWVYDYEGRDRIDEVLVAYYKAPRSYTMEDMIEIFCHGNPLIMNEIVYNCIKAGARLAKEGEFTYRAFVNGRIDLIQAEAINELIQAESMYAIKNVVKKMKGEFSKYINEIKDKLIDIIAEIEAVINFEDTDEIEDSSDLIVDLIKVKKEIQNIIKRYEKNRFISDSYKVAIVGKPNVGKSSLFNKILNKERSIITEIPGTTRDYIEERIMLEGIWVALIDTAGIRETGDKIEMVGIKKTIDIINEADSIIGILDAGEEIDERDIYLVNKWRKKICMLVLNKIDLSERRIDIKRVKELIKGDKIPIVEGSMIKDIGVDEIKKDLKERIKGLIMKYDSENMFGLNLRQYNILRNVLREVKKSEGELRKGVSLEYVVIFLNGAVKMLEEVVGGIAVEDVLDKIFSKFCIGK